MKNSIGNDTYIFSLQKLVAIFIKQFPFLPSCTSPLSVQQCISGVVEVSHVELKTEKPTSFFL